MSALIPSEEWATQYGDGHGLGLDDACPSCGAFVESRSLHRDWHLALVERLDKITAKAGRYVPPPTYFGHSLDELSAALDAARTGGSDA